MYHSPTNENYLQEKTATIRNNNNDQQSYTKMNNHQNSNIDQLLRPYGNYMLFNPYLNSQVSTSTTDSPQVTSSSATIANTAALNTVFNPRYHQHLNHLNETAFTHTKMLQEIIEKRIDLSSSRSPSPVEQSSNGKQQYSKKRIADKLESNFDKNNNFTTEESNEYLSLAEDDIKSDKSTTKYHCRNRMQRHNSAHDHTSSHSSQQSSPSTSGTTHKRSYDTEESDCNSPKRRRKQPKPQHVATDDENNSIAQKTAIKSIGNNIVDEQLNNNDVYHPPSIDGEEIEEENGEIEHYGHVKKGNNGVVQECNNQQEEQELQKNEKVMKNTPTLIPSATSAPFLAYIHDLTRGNNISSPLSIPKFLENLQKELFTAINNAIGHTFQKLFELTSQNLSQDDLNKPSVSVPPPPPPSQQPLTNEHRTSSSETKTINHSTLVPSAHRVVASSSRQDEQEKQQHSNGSTTMPPSFRLPDRPAVLRPSLPQLYSHPLGHQAVAAALHQHPYFSQMLFTNSFINHFPQIPPMMRFMGNGTQTQVAGVSTTNPPLIPHHQLDEHAVEHFGFNLTPKKRRTKCHLIDQIKIEEYQKSPESSSSTNNMLINSTNLYFENGLESTDAFSPRDEHTSSNLSSNSPGDNDPNSDEALLEYNGFQISFFSNYLRDYFCFQEAVLTSLHLRKAKLMFFYTRYPSSSILKVYFPDVRFNKLITAQLVKWFSNFREFFYIQIEKYARQYLAEGVENVDGLVISTDSDLYRILNLHYNRNNQLDVPNSFCDVVEATLKEFYHAIQQQKDIEPSWKKTIYKIIARMDDQIPDYFKDEHWIQTIQ
ncbi:unnamed protein product [Didymodactylos carnosus]|uniref:Prospero domain-containing protein n=1 Tax=Didymodactylos carnosus TaxID=1234261 RepID=A0A814C1C0_9BILA|nr:unnamed protein product [Didymodactylos carnosus]CAF3712178.1 unnamed protein product [Didymodactylos carnosus]